jgi:hypothetical protein
MMSIVEKSRNHTYSLGYRMCGRASQPGDRLLGTGGGLTGTLDMAAILSPTPGHGAPETVAMLIAPVEIAA